MRRYEKNDLAKIEYCKEKKIPLLILKNFSEIEHLEQLMEDIVNE